MRFAGVAAPPSRWLALAALLLLAAGVPYLFLREEAARRNDELEALAQQRENERAQAASAQAEAETERQRLAQVNLEQAERLKALEGLLPAVQARLLPVFLAAVRGDDDAGPEIHVAPDLDALLLVFELPGETLPAYRLRLLRANHEIWRAEPLAPGDLGLVVALPRTLLEAGSYRLEIVGLGRHETLVARPTFRVKLAG